MYENKELGFMFVLPFVLGVLLFKRFPFVMRFELSHFDVGGVAFSARMPAEDGVALAALPRGSVPTLSFQRNHAHLLVADDHGGTLPA